MKITVKNMRRAGFTLSELLVAMTIIVILASITVGVVMQSGDRVNYQKAKTLIGMIENSLESYYLDNGTYPTGTADSVTAQNLFQTLGGYGPTGLVATNAGIPVTSYADYLDPQGPNVSSSFEVVDGWGNYLRYLTPGGAGAAVTQNPDFDLWSIGGEEKEKNNDTDPSNNVNNW